MATNKKTCKQKPTLKAGDKILGTVNGMVGVIKEVRQDTINTSRGGRKSSPYAVIEVLNPQKGQQRIITTTLDNINRLEITGGVKVEKQKTKEIKPSTKTTCKPKTAKPAAATCKPKATKPAKTSPATVKPSEGKSYTVRQGRTSKTFATKSEAQACASQAKNKATITKTTKPPTHKIVKFAVKK